MENTSEYIREVENLVEEVRRMLINEPQININLTKRIDGFISTDFITSKIIKPKKNKNIDK